MGDKEVKIICYSDGAVIISEDEDNLQRRLHRFGSTAEKYNTSISVRKSRDRQRKQTGGVR
jgi:hypothetical protein